MKEKHSSGSARNNSIVLTKYGKVEGIREGSVWVWKGVPYAKAPTGNLRYRPPQPPDPWGGTRDVTRYASAAFQPGKNGGMSEDCLYLNIWSPGADHQRRPVLIWIHGGGFMVGSGSEPVYNGASFAKQGDLVVVTIQYRLGIMGFLYLDDIGGEDFRHSGNLGILDQVAALQWIQENVEAFGGDPNQVTVFGESAGGRSVGLLLALPEARGLFHRAIIQSGMISTYRSVTDAKRITSKILGDLSIGPKELTKLREYPIERIMEASPPLRPAVGLEPTIDGRLLPCLPLETLQNGCAKDIPMMIGTNLHEITPTMNPDWSGNSDEEIANIFAERIGTAWPEVAPFFLKKYEDEPTLLHRLAYLLTFHDFALPAILLGEMQSSFSSPIWLYRFDWTSPAIGGFAAHGVEVPFVFNNLNVTKALRLTGESPERQKLADQMQQTWISFARSGNPNNPGIPHWPRYDAKTRATMLFDAESHVEKDPYREERRLWKGAEQHGH